ncbi:MAG: hypothetical protein HYR85_04670 [Planctomycetes bacterium]|nr:hypothetical protein [Planctomycetota bacterium]
MREAVVRSPQPASFLRDVAGAALLICALHWDLVIHLGTHVFGHANGDAFDVLALMRWAQHALFDLGRLPHYWPDVFYPTGFRLATGTHPLWWIVALAPLARVVGETAALNLACLSFLTIAALGMVRLMRRLTNVEIAAWVAALVYAGAPTLTIRIDGHFNVLCSAAWFPFAAKESLDCAVRGDGRWLRKGIVAGLFVALTCLGHWQFLYSAPLIPACLILGVDRAQSLRERVTKLVAVLGTAAIVVLPFAWFTLRSWSRSFGPLPAADPVMAEIFSMSPDRLFVPSAAHPIWGAWTRDTFSMTREQAVVALGFSATVLAVIGVRSRPTGRAAFVSIFVLGLVMACGTFLHWNDRLVSFGAIDEIPLPMEFLRHIVPGLGAVRSWCRYEMVSAVAFAALAGVGVASLWDRGGRPRLVAVLAGACVAFESLSAPYAFFIPVATNVRPLDAWLEASADHSPVVEYPIPDVNIQAEYGQGIHGHPVVNGFAAYGAATPAAALEPLGRWPSEESIELLRKWGVRWLILNAADDREAADLSRATSAIAHVKLAEKLPGSYRVGPALVFRIE